MSTVINSSNFGNLQALLNAGDVTFSPSATSYVITSTVNIPSNRKIQGSNGVKILSQNQYAFNLNGDNVAISGISFDGPIVASFSRSCDNFNFVNNTITASNLPNSGPQGVVEWASIGWTYPLTNSKITNNVVSKLRIWTFVYGYGWKTLEIGYNEFRDRIDPSNPLGQGRCLKLHGDGGPPEGSNSPQSSQNLWVHNNYFNNVRGMAIEYQDGANNSIFEDNKYENPNVQGTDWTKNSDTFAFSIVATRSTNLICHRNYFDYSTVAFPVNRFRVGIELGGFNFLCQDNYIKGNSTTITPDYGAVSIAVNGSKASGKVINNQLVNASQPGGTTLGDGQVTNSGNSATTKLTWDINRPNPSASGTTPVPPTPIPTPSKFAITGNVQNSITSTGSVLIGLQNAPSGTTNVKVEVRATSDNSIMDNRVGPTFTSLVNAFPVMESGYHTGWQVDLRGTALSTNGTLATSDWLTLSQFPGNPNAVWPPSGVQPIPPVPPIVPSGFNVSYKAVDNQTVGFTFNNIPSGSEQVVTSCISTSGREVGNAVGPDFSVKAPFAYTPISGFHKGWDITFDSIAYDINGKDLGTYTNHVVMPS